MRRRSEIRSKGRRQFYLWKKSRKEVAKHDADRDVDIKKMLGGLS